MMKVFYDTLHTAPTTSSTARMVLECRAHHFLRDGRTLSLFPILCSYQPQGRAHSKYVYDKYTNNILRRQRLRLPKLKELLVDHETLHTHELDVYYRPRSANFATVDSWILIRPSSKRPPIVLAFHMALNATERNGKQIDLGWLGGLVPRDARRYHIILTPEGVEPQINVPTDYLTAEFLGGRDVNEAFRVFHCRIDAVKLFKP